MSLTGYAGNAVQGFWVDRGGRKTVLSYGYREFDMKWFQDNDEFAPFGPRIGTSEHPHEERSVFENGRDYWHTPVRDIPWSEVRMAYND